jgi:hypothetical protein
MKNSFVASKNNSVLVNNSAVANTVENKSQIRNGSQSPNRKLDEKSPKKEAFDLSPKKETSFDTSPRKYEDKTSNFERAVTNSPYKESLRKSLSYQKLPNNTS